MTIIDPDERLEEKMRATDIRIMANCQRGEKIEVKGTDSLEICPACNLEIGTEIHMCNCMIGKFSKYPN